MTKFLIGSAMALIATAAIAAAQSPPPALPAPAHAGHAGKVMVRGEVQTMVRTHFARMDADKDGAITTAEIAELKATHGKHGAMKMHHGAMRDPAAAFDRLDANKDGSISRDEFAKGREVRIEKRIVMREGGAGAEAKPGAKREMRMHHMGGKGGMGGGMGGGHMIIMADTDKDGRITLAEAEAMALRHFDKMDTNRDGKVTPEERRAGRPMLMKMHMAPKAG